MNKEKTLKIQELVKKFQDEFDALTRGEENFGFVMAYQNEVDEDNSINSMVSVHGRKSDVLYALGILEYKTGLVSTSARIHAETLRQMAMDKLRSAPGNEKSDDDTAN